MYFEFFCVSITIYMLAHINIKKKKITNRSVEKLKKKKKKEKERANKMMNGTY